MTNKKRNLITSVIFLVFGAFMLVQSLAVPHKIPSDVGSGYVPAFISICLLVVSGAKLILTLLDKDPADDVVKASGWSMKGGIVTMAIMLVYMLTFEPVGFILSSIVFLFALMNWFANNENRKPILFAIIAIVLPIAIDALFVFVIKMPLPKGLIGF